MSESKIELFSDFSTQLRCSMLAQSSLEDQHCLAKHMLGLDRARVFVARSITTKIYRVTF